MAATPSATMSGIDPKDLKSFATHLRTSKRIMALLGAGLSASSGLPTFRGAGGLWRTHDAISLATPHAFESDPALVWEFYSYRRHMALNAKPNPAHYALAKLAKINPDFLTISQNVDGLSPRADHPVKQLKLIHGNLFDVKCWNEHGCGYQGKNDFTDPIVPALAVREDQQAAEQSVNPQGGDTGRIHASAVLQAGIAKKNAQMSDMDDVSEFMRDTSPNHPVEPPTIPISELPHCPKCKRDLLRPGVVWFGENLPETTMHEIHQYIDQPGVIDLMLVIGTSSIVHPAAGYTQIARAKGARVAVINLEEKDAKGLTGRDWFFKGDAAVLVPELLKSIIGNLDNLGQEVTDAQEGASL